MMIRAQKQHQARVIDLICYAFKDDPQLLAYTNGEPAKMRLIARLAFETCLASNTIFLTDDLNAVALCKPSIGKGFYVKPFLINLMFPFVFGFKPLKNLMRIESVLEKTRQKTKDSLYIWMLATDPKQQGKGLGSLLLNHVDDLLPNTYPTIFLETAKESNMLYYTKRGYVLYDLMTLAPNLKVFFMRKAKASS